MIDPVEQDLKAHGIEETKFNRAVEAMIPVVMDDYTFFESFLMDEFQDIYGSFASEELIDLHQQCILSIRDNYQQHGSIAEKWLEYVNNEAVRRVEG